VWVADLVFLLVAELVAVSAVVWAADLVAG